MTLSYLPTFLLTMLEAVLHQKLLRVQGDAVSAHANSPWGSDRPKLLCDMIFAWSWASYLTSSDLGFLIYKTRIIFTQWEVVWIKWDHLRSFKISFIHLFNIYWAFTMFWAASCTKDTEIKDSILFWQELAVRRKTHSSKHIRKDTHQQAQYSVISIWMKVHISWFQDKHTQFVIYSARKVRKSLPEEATSVLNPEESLRVRQVTDWDIYLKIKTNWSVGPS